MGTADFTIFLINDDPSVLKALIRPLQAAGYKTRVYSSLETFLDEYDASIPGCAVLDLSMPGLNGLGVQQALVRQGLDRPIIFLTGRGAFRASILAMRAGATDVLLKPINGSELLQAIMWAEERDKINRRADAERRRIGALLQKLSPRERQVLTHVIAGRLNRETALTLGTAEKTIKVHRCRMMEKMGVRSVAELVRMTEMISLQPYQIVNSVGPKANSFNGLTLK